MRIPQVTDRMKEAPTQALRAFFSGIGQFLMTAEKTRNGPGQAGVAAGVTTVSGPEQGRNASPAQAADPYSSRWRSLDKTGNVRILEPDELEPETSQRPGPVPAAGPTVRPGPAAEPEPPAVPEPATVPEAVGGPGQAWAGLAELPVPSYDTLSLASVRARLRMLDRDQLTVLLDYERAGARRADFLTMFERRIAKLDGTSHDGTSHGSAGPGRGQA
jgi:hypothetical protein